MPLVLAPPPDDDCPPLGDITPPIRPAPTPGPPLVETASEFLSRYIPVDWVIDGLLIRGYVYGLTSRPNHGKTTVATAISLHVACGEPFAGAEVQGGNVLMLLGENAENSRLMLIAAAQHLDLSTSNVEIVSTAAPLEGILEDVIAGCRRDDYALVVVDSSAAYYSGGDENDNVQAGEHARTLRRLTSLPGRPAVLVCCHPTKAAERENMYPRGGSAFLAEIDTNLTIWASDGTIELSHNKVRGPVIDALSLRVELVTLQGYVDRKARPVQAPVASPMTDVQAAIAHKATVEADNRLLFALLHHPKESLAEWARLCGWLTAANLPEKYKVSRALVRLQTDKLVSKSRHGWYLTSAGKSEAEQID